MATAVKYKGLFIEEQTVNRVTIYKDGNYINSTTDLSSAQYMIDMGYLANKSELQLKTEKLIKEYESKIEQLQPTIKATIKATINEKKAHKKKVIQATNRRDKKEHSNIYNEACEFLEALKAKSQCYIEIKAELEKVLNQTTTK